MATTLVSTHNLYTEEDLIGVAGPNLGMVIDPSVLGVLISGIPAGMAFNYAGSSAGLPAGTLRFTAAEAANLQITKLPLHDDTDRQLSVTPLVAGDSTITVRVSGDSNGILPKMALVVDNTQIGSTVAISASHAAGQWQDVTFKTHLGGSNDIKVAFLNDTQSGESGDRNLFVQSVTVNGQVLSPAHDTYSYMGNIVAGQSAMYWQGVLDWKTSLLAPSLIDKVPAGATSKFWVDVDAVAQAPTLSTAAVSGSAGTWITLPVKAALADTDGTEKLSLTVTDLPDGSSLRSGTTAIAISNHTAQITPAQLADLEFKAAAGASGTLNLHVTATATEIAQLNQKGYWEGTLANNTATATVTQAVSLTAAAPAPTPSVIASDYLQTHHFFADSSPWNTKMAATTTYSAISTIGNYPLVLTSWLKDGGNVSIYYAHDSDPVRQVKSNTHTWDHIYDGSWLHSGNSATVEQQILSSSTDTNPYPMNPYSTQNASLYWNNGGAPASYDKAAPGPTYAHIPDAALPTGGTDGYTVVIQPDGTALEMYSPIKLSSGTWVSMMTSFTPALSGQGDGHENGRTASMVENYAGALRDTDFTHATIDHALALVAPPAMLTTAFTGPALAFDSNPNYSGTLPMGSRLALPHNLDVSTLGLTTDLGNKIAHAVQDYGMFVVDRGGSGFTLVTDNNPKTTSLNTWTSDMQKDLDTIIHHSVVAHWQ